MKKSSHPHSEPSTQGRAISIVSDAKSTETTSISAFEIVSNIKDGKWRGPVERIRSQFSAVWNETGDEKAAKAAVSRLKNRLPGVMPSGQFSSREAPTAEKLTLHSGLLCADLDTLGTRLAVVRTNLMGSPHLWAMFTSPTGSGLKCWFCVSAGATHEANFHLVTRYVQTCAGEQIDKACKDVGRLCFISFDPEAYLNTSAKDLLGSESVDIRLPTASGSCLTASLNDCVAASLDHCIAVSLYNNGSSILANVTGRNEAQQALKKEQPELSKLYVSLIETRFLAFPHGRNAFLTQAVPFLYRAVAEKLILPLIGHFYDCNRALFQDSRADHMKEARAMLNGVAKTYFTSLGAEELAIYQALPSQLHRDLFRICRDFALLSDPLAGPFTFFSSFEHLAMRLGSYPIQVQRIMRQLEGQGLLRLIAKGKRWEPGVKAVSGTYHWLVPAAHRADPNLLSK